MSGFPSRLPNGGQAARRRVRLRWHAPRPAVTATSAIAAVEFALVAPVLLLALAAASDYGLRTWSRSCLANAVAEGAYYAFRTGTSVTSANIVTMVRNASTLRAASVSATATDPTVCYCPTGMVTTPTPAAATLGTAHSCTTNCTDGTTPGNYVTITATYTLTGYFSLGAYTTRGKTIAETVTVRLK
jgi:Flp pilus assembly protein TadG